MGKNNIKNGICLNTFQLYFYLSFSCIIFFLTFFANILFFIYALEVLVYYNGIFNLFLVYYFFLHFVIFFHYFFLIFFHFFFIFSPVLIILIFC